MTNKIEISLTDFIGFVNKTGAARFNHVKAIKKRDEYKPCQDFYKLLREKILKMHKENLSKKSLDHLVELVTDKNKKKNYPGMIRGYKKFLGRKKFNWFDPLHKKWNFKDISININPELGLEEIKKDGSSKFYIIKLFFNKEGIKKQQVEQILTLMEYQLRDEVKEPEVTFAVLNVSKGKLYTNDDHSKKYLPLLEGEAGCFMSIWENLD